MKMRMRSTWMTLRTSKKKKRVTSLRTRMSSQKSTLVMKMKKLKKTVKCLWKKMRMMKYSWMMTMVLRMLMSTGLRWKKKRMCSKRSHQRKEISRKRSPRTQDSPAMMNSLKFLKKTFIMKKKPKNTSLKLPRVVVLLAKREERSLTSTRTTKDQNTSELLIN